MHLTIFQLLTVSIHESKKRRKKNWIQKLRWPTQKRRNENAISDQNAPSRKKLFALKKRTQILIYFSHRICSDIQLPIISNTFYTFSSEKFVVLHKTLLHFTPFISFFFVFFFFFYFAFLPTNRSTSFSLCEKWSGYALRNQAIFCWKAKTANAE